jgi:hypothetical protein
MQTTEGWRLDSAPFYRRCLTIYSAISLPQARRKEMSTIRHCNKDYTPSCERSILKYCSVVELFEKRGIPPPPPASHFGGRIWHLGDSIWHFFSTCKSRQPSVACTPLYRQHLCRGQCIQERSWSQRHTWNSKPFVIFPAELLLHKVYISNILCGLRLWIQDIYSKEKPLLAMFISTSNEHILDKTMIKIRGLTICLIRVSVQRLTCWHCSLF